MKRTLPSGAKVYRSRLNHNYYHPGGWGFPVDGNGDDSIEWACRYADGAAEENRMTIASLLDAYAYLLGRDISTTAACAKLREMRRVIKENRDTPECVVPWVPIRKEVQS